GRVRAPGFSLAKENRRLVPGRQVPEKNPHHWLVASGEQHADAVDDAALHGLHCFTWERIVGDAADPLGELSCQSHGQFGVMPVSRTTLPHRSTSSRTCRPKASGVPVTISLPALTRVCTTSGISMILRISVFRRVTMLRGVPAGAKNPCQPSTAYSG